MPQPQALQQPRPLVGGLQPFGRSPSFGLAGFPSALSTSRPPSLNLKAPAQAQVRAPQGRGIMQSPAARLGSPSMPAPGGPAPAPLVSPGAATGLTKAAKAAFDSYFGGPPATQADFSGSDPQAYLAYRAGERDAFGPVRTPGGGSPDTGAKVPMVDPTTGETKWVGVGMGALQSGLGVLNLVRGAQGGNIPGAIGGGAQTLGGLSNILQASPALASTLGISPSLLSGVGGAASGVGGLLGLYSGANALAEGDVLGGASGLLSGGLGTYAAIQSLSAAYPALFGGTVLPTISGAIGSLFGGGAAAGAGAAAAGGSIGGIGAASSAAGAGAGVGGAGAAGLGAISGPAAAVAAAWLPVMLIDMATGGNMMGDALKKSQGDYPSFGADLGLTLGAERAGLDTLTQALPYVQSQAQLGSLLDQFKAHQAQRIGGYGAGSDRFTIPGLPGAGGSEHEWGQTASFAEPVSELNQTIQGLRPLLPATGGGPPGSLWSQMFLRGQSGREAARGGAGPNAPPQMWARLPDGSFTTITQAEYNANPLPVAENVFYGDPRYSYAKQGLLAPGQAPSGAAGALSISPYWQQLIGAGSGA